MFGYQAALIGLKVRNEKYALAVMNNAEPSPSEVAAFENDLKGRKVKAMLYNAQASQPAVAKLVQMAKDNGIPVIGVSETEPPNSTYQDGMIGQLTRPIRRWPAGRRMAPSSRESPGSQPGATRRSSAAAARVIPGSIR